MKSLSLVLIFLVGSVALEASFFPNVSTQRKGLMMAQQSPEQHEPSLVDRKVWDLRLSKLQDRFQAMVAAQGGELKLKMNWQSTRLNAIATKQDHLWVIEFHGGLVSQPQIGMREFSLIFCHELGHFLGGDPKASRGGWSSTEGQADFWSTQSCFKKTQEMWESLSQSKEAQDFCLKQSLIGSVDILLCEQTIETSLLLTRYYATMTQSSFWPQLSNPAREAERTNFGYPDPDCRLKTLVSGFFDYQRPSCWFKP
jgi:hypothetical protein